MNNVAGLSEPSGLSYDKKAGIVYVADTNNHTVRVLRENEGWDSSNLSVADRARHTRNTGVSWVLKQVLYITMATAHYVATVQTTLCITIATVRTSL